MYERLLIGERAGFRWGGADGLAIADLDRDGFPEVISVHEDSAHVRIAFGTDDPDRWIRFTLAEGTDLVGKVEGTSFDGVVWLEQVRITQPKRNFTPARVRDSPEISRPLRLR